MDFRRLECFVAVAEELHFGRAARKLHVAQPAITRQIQLLERELGVALFDRDRRGVTLTFAGDALIPLARRALKEADRVSSAAAGLIQGRLTGRLQFGFPSDAAFDALPRVIRRIRQDQPGLTLSLQELPSRDVLENLMSGTLDAGLLHLPSRDLDINSIDIVSEPLLVAMPSDHPHAQGDSVALESLSDESFILFDRKFSPGHWDAVVSACYGAGFSPRFVYDCFQIQTIIGLVAAGVGIALVPSSASRIRISGVRFIALDPEVPPLVLTMAWKKHQESRLPPALAAVVESEFALDTNSQGARLPVEEIQRPHPDGS